MHVRRHRNSGKQHCVYGFREVGDAGNRFRYSSSKGGVVVRPQENGKYFEYGFVRILLTIGGRDVPDIVEESEKERIETIEAQLALHANKSRYSQARV